MAGGACGKYSEQLPSIIVMKKSLLLIGGGGHCRSCIDVIEAEAMYEIAGVIDSADKIGSRVLNYPVVSDDEGIDEYIKKGFYFLLTIGQIKSSLKRQEIYNLVKSKKGIFATVISPSATVSSYASIGEGTIVMHNVIVNASAVVGNNVILNTGCLIEHDVTIGDHVHVSTHAVVNGTAIIGESSFVGSNATIAQEVKIGKEIILGAGAVAIRDMATPGIYVGNPAKLLTK